MKTIAQIQQQRIDVLKESIELMDKTIQHKDDIIELQSIRITTAKSTFDLSDTIDKQQETIETQDAIIINKDYDLHQLNLYSNDLRGTIKELKSKVNGLTQACGWKDRTIDKQEEKIKVLNDDVKEIIDFYDHIY
jgi:chromosome segregation ATPase